MKILTNKSYNSVISTYENKLLSLEKELQEARDLRSIVSKLSDSKYISIYDGVSISGGGYFDPLKDSSKVTIDVGGRLMEFVADELSDEVIIKSRSTPIVFMDKDGKVSKTGYTRMKPDKGFAYKLVRNK